MAGDDDDGDEEMALTRTGKVRLELRKTTVKKKRRIDNNKADDNNNHQSVVAAFFGAAEVDGKGDTMTRPTADETTDPQEPLVIPVAPNKSKFIRKSDADTSADDDERAAQALVEASAMKGSSATSSSTRSISIPVVASSSSSAPNKHDNQDKDKDVDVDEDRDKEDRLYQKELEMLPTELTETDDAYDRVPIADFGAALLRGMGWQDDESDAKNNKKSKRNDKDNEPTALPRPHRLGLGAMPKAVEEISHRPLRPDEYDRRQKQRAQHQEFIAQHEKKKLSDPQQTLQDGSIVYLVVVAGDDHPDDDPDKAPSTTTWRGGERRRARIVKLRGVPGLNKVQIQYESPSLAVNDDGNDGETTTTTIVSKSRIDRLVTRSELMDRPFREPPAASPKKQPVPEPSTSSSSNGKKKRTMPPVTSSSSAQIGNDNRDASRQSGQKHGKSSKVEPREDDDQDDDEAAEPSNWLIPNIRVRVITKKLGKAYYKAKGIVLDVTRKGATIQMDNDGKLIDRVPTRYVETALPKPGGRCIVVGQRKQRQYRQTKGRLLERHKHTAIMQESENGTAITIPLDDLAEWCGPADEEEGNF
jgi:G patch domain and KOW motifs-containing protein